MTVQDAGVGCLHHVVEKGKQRMPGSAGKRLTSPSLLPPPPAFAPHSHPAAPVSRSTLCQHILRMYVKWQRLGAGYYLPPSSPFTTITITFTTTTTTVTSTTTTTTITS